MESTGKPSCPACPARKSKPECALTLLEQAGQAFPIPAAGRRRRITLTRPRRCTWLLDDERTSGRLCLGLPRLFRCPLLLHAHTALRQQDGLLARHERLVLDNERVLLVGGQAGLSSVPLPERHHDVPGQPWDAGDGREALSHITENRKVDPHKSLILQHTICRFCLQKATLRQSQKKGLQRYPGKVTPQAPSPQGRI